MTGSNPGLRRRDGVQPYLSRGGAKALSVSIVFTSLACLFVVARVYTRRVLMKRMEGNDWMVLIALLFSFVFMGFFIMEALNGIGMHGADIPPEILFKQMKAFWITIPFYNAALLSAKASILLQYYRVFQTSRMRTISWVMLGVLATYGSWAVLSGFLNCIPVAKFWDPSITGYCLNQKGLWFSNAAMHIATDLAILIIPIPALIRLEIPKRQKIALISVFALGGFVCVTSVCRLVSLKKISESDDPTYDNVGAAAWSAIECNTGIICACLPTLRPLISRFVPHLLSSFSATTEPYSNTPLSHAQAPSYWNGTGTVMTTISRGDDLEYGREHPERMLTLVSESDFDGKRKLTVKQTKDVEAAKEPVVGMEARAESTSSSEPSK